MQIAPAVPYLTLPLTIFTFVAVILINIGGVNPGEAGRSSLQLVREKNSAFNLLNWKYTVTPRQSYPSYEYHLYLNRLCSDPQTATGNLLSSYCRNSRGNGKLEDGRNIYSPSGYIAAIHPFRFDTVNLNAPFAFYILTAVCSFLLLLWAPFGGKKFSRMAALSGTLVSGLAMIFILIASAVLSAQLVRLKHQLENDTQTLTLVVGTSVRTTINNVSLGSVVLGLTWASVAAMIFNFFTWAWALLVVRKEKPVVATKEEHYVQG